MSAKKNFRPVLTHLLLTAFVAWGQSAEVNAAAFAPSNVPLANIDTALSNVALALSVEFPTADTASYRNNNITTTNACGTDWGNYCSTQTYYGYFDPVKCYSYDTVALYFSPATCTSATPKGNFLNWVSMSNLDQFRRVMTGGTRFTGLPLGSTPETATQTILQRSFLDALTDRSGGDGNTNQQTVADTASSLNVPHKSAKTADAGNMGSSTTSWIYKNSAMGDKMLAQSGTTLDTVVSTPANFSSVHTATQNCAALKATFKAAISGGRDPQWTCYHMRVKVCNSASGLETNCTQYGTNYKPEGLMQQYNLNMRFSSVGYLVDNSKTNNQQGGVLTARMKSVGPTINSPISGTAVNSAKEWDSTTGVYTVNPDSADATASSTRSGITIANSGVMNYLNKFGYTPDPATGYAYKYYDPMAELYYDTLRYLRGMAASTQSQTYATSSYPTRFGGFPAINFQGMSGGTPTGVDDPVLNACQGNFIITIGDANNACDTSINGGTACSGGSTTIPQVIASGTPAETVNFMTPTTTIAGWDTLTNSSGSASMIAGAAYWAHINDIRPEKAANRLAGQIQNVTTYVVDVMEQIGGAAYDGTKTTQLWGAAKYGGFDLTLTDQTSTTTRNNPNTFKSGSTVKSWDAYGFNGTLGGNGIPDNWYAGNDPLTLQWGLTNVFDKIVSAGTSGDGAAPATSGVSLATATSIYYAGYSLANGGRGFVKACAFSSNAKDCNANPTWDASQWLNPNPVPSSQYPTPLTNSTRKIITRSGGAGTAFLYASLASADKTNLSYNPATQVADPVTTPTLAQKRVDYIRGDSSNEIRNGGPLRSRFQTKLGDIAGSGPVYVGAPSALFSGDKFPGYSTFISNNKGRTPVVYAGANDGMLHAFNAATGQEMMAYVPGYFLQPDASKSAARISSLTDPAYTHKFFVDATPIVGDLQISSTWTTLLVGSYGAGGKGFYALDVTNPANFSEANASTLSKWEISDSTDSDIGYSYNQPTYSPISGQTLQYALVPTGQTTSQWAIIVGNGFGSTSGKAALLFLNPADGAISTKVIVESVTGSNGLATPYPVDTNQDGLVDTLWAGDLQGTLWRVRWDQAACKADATKCTWVSTAIYNAGSGQPITSAPSATSHCSIPGAWNIVFGTGKYIERTDYNTTTQQTVYGMVDRLTNPFTTVVKADLVQQTILSTSSINSSTGDFTRTFSNNTINYATKKGWYLDLPTTNGERVVSNAVIPADTGVVLVGSFTPATACLPITGYVNVLNACTGGKAYNGLGVEVLGMGGVGSGIPYFTPPVSSGTSVTVKWGGDRVGYTGTPQDHTDFAKSFTRGVRASWRQIR